jgi:hypothetical protein
MMDHAVVYTAICGGYDALKAPVAQSVACDWLAFSDAPLPEDTGWQVRPLANPDDLNARLLSRSVKVQPLRFLKGQAYRYAIWIDGSVAITSSEFVATLIDALQGQPLALWTHPQRDCIFDEVAVCAALPKYGGYDLLGQVNAYAEAGYPRHNGLPANTVMIYDLAHPALFDLSILWWAEHLRWGTMDQLSLPFVLWLMDLWWDVLPGHIWHNDLIRLIQHQGADELRLNLGCANHLLAGWQNVDITPGPGVTVADLRERWPWADGSVHEVLAADVIEHLPDKIHTMNELHRVLIDGCHVEIVVPTTDGPGAFQDPTHVSFWHRNSFRYYTAGDPYRERFAESYGIKAAFWPQAERIIETSDGPKLQIRLAAVKNGRLA